MAESRRNHPTTQREPPAVCVPSGAPTWVTLELIEQTLRVWQPFYQDQLISEDALEIIMSVGLLIEALSVGGYRETVHRPGSGQQP
jgi:hypothetical protein